MEITLQPEQLRRVFSKNVRARRKELALTQQAVGDRCGVAAAHIAQYEAGTKVPSFENLAKLAEALQTSPHALLDPTVFSAAVA